MNEQQVKDLIQQMIDNDNTVNQFAVSQTPYHTHNSSDSSSLDYSLLTGKSRYIVYRIVRSDVQVTTGTKISGDFVFPFSGNFVSVTVTVDIAGSTNDTLVQLNLNGKVLMNPATIAVPSSSKTSLGGYMQTFITDNFSQGDILTFDVNSVSSTAPLGMTIYIKVNER